jgi:SAM-dependent methyltransferase
MYREIQQCRICGNPELELILDLGMQALTGFFPKTPTPVERGPLELVRCHTARQRDACGLVQLRHSFAPEQMYGDAYGYRSGLNRSMVKHLQEKAAEIRKLVPLSSGDVVLDIGSNDGTLLAALNAPGVEVVGMDPSAIRFAEFYPPNARKIPDFFSAKRYFQEVGRRRAKVVTSIAMFYDLESPLQFMREVFEVLADDGIWVFEQSYLPRMLAANSYDTICHEHLEYYSLKQVLWMADKVGFEIVGLEFNAVNGGSFSVTAAKKKKGLRVSAAVAKTLSQENDFGLHGKELYQAFADRVHRHRTALVERLTAMNASGLRVFGYGASTKGNVLLQYCGITSSMVSCIAEVNPDKFGSYTPGTLIPIISESDARARKPDVFLVLPWHFRDNIMEREKNFLQQGGRLLFPLPTIEIA